MLGRVNEVSGHVKTQLIAHDKVSFEFTFVLIYCSGTFIIHR